jgi:hypothetical protein
MRPANDCRIAVRFRTTKCHAAPFNEREAYESPAKDKARRRS